MHTEWLISRDLNYCKQVSWVLPSGINNSHSYHVTSCYTVFCILFYLDHHSASLHNGVLLLPFSVRRFLFFPFLLNSFLFTSPIPILQLCLAGHFFERLTQSVWRHCLTLNRTQITLEDSECRPLTSDPLVRATWVLTFPTRFCMVQADRMLTVIVVLHFPASCSFLRPTAVSPISSLCWRILYSLPNTTVWFG